LDRAMRDVADNEKSRYMAVGLTCKKLFYLQKESSGLTCSRSRATTGV